MEDKRDSDHEISQFRNVVPMIVKTKPISLSPAAVVVSVKPSDGSTSLVTPWSSEQAMVTTASQVDDSVTSLPNSISGQDFENYTKSTSVNRTLVNVPEKRSAKSPRNSRLLEATFTSPSGDLSQEDGTTKVKGYHALAVEFTPTTSTSASTSSKKRGSRGDAGPLCSSSTEHLVSDHEEETVVEAVLAFVLSVFGPLWALGIAYLHYEQESFPAALLTCVGLLLSVVVTMLVYIVPSKSPRRDVWKGSKIIWLLCICPGAAPIILSFCNIIFAIRERGSRSYERPWKGTRAIFLAESLALAFPQSVLHLVILVERTDPVETYQDYATVAGIAVLSFSITFARFRYDILDKGDRFGVGFEKWVRFVCLWANKALWISSFTLTIICARLFAPTPMMRSGPIIAGLALIIAVHEIPVFLLMCPWRSSNLLGGIMMIPQTTALLALLVWVNLNPALYKADTGSMLLGVFFWAELFILSGWLYDRCTGREIDFMAFYPHFLGDICTNLRT